jgi:hypothetical protein
MTGTTRAVAAGADVATVAAVSVQDKAAVVAEAAARTW